MAEDIKIEIRSLTKNELPDAVQLSNLVFRLDNDLDPTMHKEYPLLFNEANIDNLMAVFVNNKIVTFIGTNIWTISLNGLPLNVASMGSVCTHQDMRGRGYASKLVEAVVERLKNKQVGLVLISGRRGLYKRSGAMHIGCNREFILSPSMFTARDIDSINIELQDSGLGLENVRELAILYSQRAVKHKRTYNQFKELLRAGKYQKTEGYEQRVVIIREHGKEVGYFVVRFPLKKSDTLQATIVEYAGDIHSLYDGVKELFNLFPSIGELKLDIPHQQDRFIQMFKELSLGDLVSTPKHTARITDLSLFWTQLQPFFAERVPVELLNSLKLDNVEAGIYRLTFQTKLVLEGDLQLFQKLILGCGSEFDVKSVVSNTEAALLLSDIFPIPTWQIGLNYV